MRCFVLAVAAAVAATVSGNTFTLSPCPPTARLPVNATPSSVVCLQSINGTVKVIVANGTHVNLSNQNITYVSAVPRGIRSIDLSMNNLGYVALADSVLENIDLSGSRVSSLSSLSLPATVKHLDLSRNSIALLNGNWARLVKLTSLNMSSNLITMLNKPAFPPSLQTLDLSKNQFFMADVDGATFTLLSSINVVYSLDPSLAQLVISSCRDIGDLRRLNQNATSLVCVFDKNRAEIQDDMFVALRRLTLVSLFLSVALILGYAGLHWYRRRRGLDEDTVYRGRETLSSSACEAYDREPIQYRQTLTPVAAPQPDATERARNN